MAAIWWRKRWRSETTLEPVNILRKLWPGYEFVHTDKDKDGNTSHLTYWKPVKRKLTTIWVTEKGEVLKFVLIGGAAEENFDSYGILFSTESKDKDSNTTHIYRPIKEEVTTI